MKFINRVDYHFLGVGQGLFSAGVIWNDAEHDPRFMWVYDCGTSSSQKLIGEGIERLKRETNSRRKINLLVLSHFDRDHISGVLRLLQQFEVDTLMLPYMPLAQRLIIAFEERIDPDSELVSFFVNPVGYLASRAEFGIQRFLVVPPAAEGGVPPSQPIDDPTPDPETRDQGDEEIDLEMVYEEGETGKTTSQSERDIIFTDGEEGRVQLMADRSVLRVGGEWEFIPYNDDSRYQPGFQFRQAVEGLRDEILSGYDDRARLALNDLKDNYDREFGRDSENRNAISLFLYFGPLRSSEYAFSRLNSSSWIWSNVDKIYPTEVDRWTDLNNASLLYSGDGYLDGAFQLKQLVDYLGSDRIGKVAVFQVMHHGAEANWHKGVADKICPQISVFSSDPLHKRFKHPHAPVLHDFWGYGAIQVDKVSSLKIEWRFY